MMRRLFLVIVLLASLTATAGNAQIISDNADQAFQTLRQFYAMRNYHTIWISGARFTSKAHQLPDILARAGTQGLDPEAYGVSKMRALLSAGLPDDPLEREQAEMLWTYGLWQYASDLADQGVDAPTLESIVDGDIADNVQALAPEDDLYKALQNRLAQLDAGQTTQAPIAFGPKLFKPGMSHAHVPNLRARMVALGAYDGGSAGDPNVYDPSLAKAVARFQHDSGLTDDGSIGPATLALLNRDAQAERAQILANMQRLREPHRRLREDRRIEVSIARYQLTGFDNGKPAITMAVVVGQPRRQTISFRTEISGVRLNPTWTVPSTIKKEDIIPELLADPMKMVRKHNVKIIAGGKTIADPSQVDWSQFSPGELMQVGFQAPAGDGNPLGRYRVIMENPYDIYLHDTNHPDLFQVSMRAQSSGCVRVSRPEELTTFILERQTGWNPQKIKKIVADGHTTDVVIENKIPIYLDYLTAWFNDRRQLVLGADVYALDKPRYEILIKNGLTSQRNAQRILNRATDILEPELKEAQHRDAVLTQSTN